MPDRTGVKFGDVHSYDDWKLRLKEIRIGIPEIKTEYVDVAGMNGRLDLTEQQNGGVKYGSRVLEFDFDARNCGYRQWSSLTSKISSAIHGQKLHIILDTDPGYYYLGRCTVNTEKTNEAKANITISCECDPFKIDVTASSDQWKWDTFSFVDGVIRDTADILIASTDMWQEVDVVGWDYNEIPTVISDADMEMKWNEEVFEIVSGENIMYDVTLSPGENKLYFRGDGNVTIICKGGMI